MDGRILPDGLLVMTPVWRNLFENVLTVQFNHRLTAYAVAAVAGLLIWRLLTIDATERAQQAARWLGAAVTVQIALGIWTLIARVPLWLGLAHQLGALAVFAAALWCAYVARHSSEPIRRPTQ